MTEQKNQEKEAALSIEEPTAPAQQTQMAQEAAPVTSERPVQEASPAGEQEARSDTAQPSSAPEQKRRSGKKAKPLTPLRVIGRIASVLGVTLVGLLTLTYGVCYIVCKGPSPAARDLFVNTMLETSALKFVPNLFFSEEEVQRIVEKNAVIEPDEITDQTQPFEPPQDDVPLDTIEIVDVQGSTYKGKMMIVHDPSRVKVACLDSFSGDTGGKRIAEFVEEAGAVAGINAGGFADAGGVGNGGMPLGLVIKDGKVMAGSMSSEYSIIGFDQNDRLIVGTMTGQQAVDMGLRDVVCFGPAFIINGEAADVAGAGSGLNPRTVIGQRADGAVLFLVIDGRQPQSLGANYKDCIEVMQQFGAINAANLDGGSSTQMYYQGETINSCASLYGPRRMPTAWLVQ